VGLKKIINLYGGTTPELTQSMRPMRFTVFGIIGPESDILNRLRFKSLGKALQTVEGSNKADIASNWLAKYHALFGVMIPVLITRTTYIQAHN
jgi:hypothetical protein